LARIFLVGSELYFIFKDFFVIDIPAYTTLITENTSSQVEPQEAGASTTSSSSPFIPFSIVAPPYSMEHH